MRKPVVDYRTFRLSKLRDPQFNHLLYLLGWVGYFALYFITENFIPRETCHVIYSPLDDMIPFCEYFVIPYTFWYLLIVGTLLYFNFYNTVGFKQFMSFIIVTQVVAMAIYILYPNRQDLRPETFENNNVFTWIVGQLYAFDTSTNVCPSLHVAYSIGIASAWLKEKEISPWFKAFIVFSAIMICLSTAFIKQHSIVDAFVAIPVCILAEVIAYGKSYWMPKLKKKA
ncbi:MAG: phosphatidic acid phosphatase [Clostridia bacterium]|nr:phosphatidic acid phosphatase [Clostridia bacterium]